MNAGEGKRPLPEPLPHANNPPIRDQPAEGFHL